MMSCQVAKERERGCHAKEDATQPWQVAKRKRTDNIFECGTTFLRPPSRVGANDDTNPDRGFWIDSSRRMSPPTAAPKPPRMRTAIASFRNDKWECVTFLQVGIYSHKRRGVVIARRSQCFSQKAATSGRTGSLASTLTSSECFIRESAAYTAA